MQRVHFIAIGGLSTLNLAIAISRKSNFKVTGSDIFITESASELLKNYSLYPDELGWNPENHINKQLNAVVIDSLVQEDNPEYLRAKELGLKIYTVPEFIFQQTRSKARIVVIGNDHKSLISSIIIHTLQFVNMDVDYSINPTNKIFDFPVKLSFDSRIAVFEADDYMYSSVDTLAQVHVYKPHIAVVTRLEALPNPNANLTQYTDYLKSFILKMEVQGRLVCASQDDVIIDYAQKQRRDIVTFGYQIPDFTTEGGEYSLLTKKGNVPLKIRNLSDLSIIDAARIACRQIGVSDHQFYSAIVTFPEFVQ